MFCPSCGFGYTQKTNYCKRCGANLNPAGDTDAPKETRPNVIAMFWGAITFCLTAMALLFVMYDYFVRRGLRRSDEPILVFFMLFSFAVAVLLIWQVARMITALRRTEQNVTVEKHFIHEVPPIQPVAQTDQVQEVPEAVVPSSVVEHTTRQMARVYNEPKAVK